MGFELVDDYDMILPCTILNDVQQFRDLLSYTFATYTKVRIAVRETLVRQSKYVSFHV